MNVGMNMFRYVLLCHCNSGRWERFVVAVIVSFMRPLWWEIVRIGNEIEQTATNGKQNEWRTANVVPKPLRRVKLVVDLPPMHRCAQHIISSSEARNVNYDAPRTSHTKIYAMRCSYSGAMPLNCPRYYTKQCNWLNRAARNARPSNATILFSDFPLPLKQTIQMPAKTHLIVSAWLRKLR